MNSVEEKREALQLQSAMLDEGTKVLVVRQFERTVIGLMSELMNPDKTEVEALAIRYQALGVLRAITDMAGDLGSIESTIRRAAHKKVREAVGDTQPWS